MVIRRELCRITVGSHSVATKFPSTKKKMLANMKSFFIVFLSSVYFVHGGDQPTGIAPVPIAIPALNPSNFICVLNTPFIIISVFYIFLTTSCTVVDFLIVTFDLYMNLFKNCPIKDILGYADANINQIIIGLRAVKTLCPEASRMAQIQMDALRN